MPIIVFDELAAWYPEDLVDIQYKRNGSSSFQSLQQASAGQRLQLFYLLAHGDEPLLMDQPEDDLIMPSIATGSYTIKK